MKIQWKKLIPSVLLPLAVGGLAALLTRKGMREFAYVNQPPLSPPAWVFPVVWTILYTLMGIACYLVWIAPKKANNAFFAYFLQLFFNFFWSILFFGAKAWLIAFLWLLLLLAFVIWTALLFYRSDKTAGKLLIPYAIWIAFAGYLNFGVYLLNR